MITITWGVGAGGNDIMLFNILSFLFTAKSMPKAIVVQWPEMSRVVTSNATDDSLHTIGPWMEHKSIRDFMVSGEEINFFGCRETLSGMIINRLQTKIINIRSYYKKNKVDSL